jgi:hypothetical protein
MPVIKCPKGHFYDDVKYASCPICDGLTQGSGEDGKTVSLVAREQMAKEALQDLARKGQDEKTIGIFKAKMKSDPVVGWLVCLEGSEKGRDYRLHTGRNFLGRAMSMDVCIVDDPGISRENHCSIAYDPVQNHFFIVPGEGSNTYHNEKMLSQPMRLNDYDHIQIGDSTLIFVAFCGGERKWI